MNIKKNSPDEIFSKKFGLFIRLTQKAFRADHFGILFDGFKTIPAKEKPKIRP